MNIKVNHSIGTGGRSAVAICLGLMVGAGYMAPMLAMRSLSGITIAVLLGLCTAAGVFLWRPAGRLRTVVAASAFIASSLVAISLPLAKDGYPDLRIIATGEKNPKSNSSEVFVSLLSEHVQGVRDFEGAGWEKRNNVFVSYQKQPTVLHYRGSWSTGAVLRLIRHPYSGIAEVSIGGSTQRLDLFSEKETYIDVPLPEGSVSWRGYLQRAAVAIGLGISFAAAGVALATASAAWGAIFMLALLVGCGSLWLVHDRSYAGLMEAVAFVANTEPVRIEMDAGHGFTPALAVPVKSGAAVSTEFVVDNPIDWQLGIEGGTLRVFRDLDVSAAREASSGTDNNCASLSKSSCIYEVQGAGPLRAWLQAGNEQKALPLPVATAGSERLFLLVEREPGRIAVSASRAYLQLSPWEHFSSWIVAMRVIEQDGKVAGKLVRLLSDGAGGYQTLQPGAKGSYLVPTVRQPNTGSFVAMKIFAGLIGASIVLLIAAVVKVTLALAHTFREGRRLQVLASVFGCIGWLGFGAVAGWPAIIGWDGFSPYIQAQTGAITLWYGLGYPIIIGGFLLLGSGPLVTAWSVLCTVVLLLGAAALLLRCGSALASWLPPVLLCVLLPFTAVMVGMMTHLRDAMNGLMLAMFAFSGFYTALKWKRWSRVQRNWTLAGLLLGGAVLTLLRIDNFPTLFVLAVGLALGISGFNVRVLALVAVTALSWIVIGAQVERFAVPNREAAAQEKHFYSSTAVINPLAGMLVYGKGRIPDALYTDIRDTLGKVMDADVAIQRWSPYHIIYWHDTNGERGIPSVETNNQLRTLYLHAFKSDPVLFIKLRLATFGGMLGHDWFEPEEYQKANGSGHPSFHNHLLTTDPNWRHLSELLGYSPAPHALPDLTQSLLDWEARVASTVPQLIVCIVVALCFRRTPLAAVVALGEIVRAGVFFLLAPASVFFYLYDMHLLGFLLPMMALTEHAMRSGGRSMEGER